MALTTKAAQAPDAAEISAKAAARVAKIPIQLAKLIHKIRLTNLTMIFFHF